MKAMIERFLKRKAAKKEEAKEGEEGGEEAPDEEEADDGEKPMTNEDRLFELLEKEYRSKRIAGLDHMAREAGFDIEVWR